MATSVRWTTIRASGVAPGPDVATACLRENLEERGIRTGVFTMCAPSPMMCGWTSGQRRGLRQRAEPYDTVVVMGCDSALVSVRRALTGTGCRAVLGMELTGLTNALATFELPLTINLEQNTLVGEGASDTALDP